MSLVADHFGSLVQKHEAKKTRKDKTFFQKQS